MKLWLISYHIPKSNIVLENHDHLQIQWNKEITKAKLVVHASTYPILKVHVNHHLEDTNLTKIDIVWQTHPLKSKFLLYLSHDPTHNQTNPHIITNQIIKETLKKNNQIWIAIDFLFGSSWLPTKPTK